MIGDEYDIWVLHLTALHCTALQVTQSTVLWRKSPTLWWTLTAGFTLHSGTGTAFTSTQLSKVGLPLPVSLFFRNRGGFVIDCRADIAVCLLFYALYCSVPTPPGQDHPLAPGLIPLSYMPDHEHLRYVLRPLAWQVCQVCPNGRSPTPGIYSENVSQICSHA